MRIPMLLAVVTLCACGPIVTPPQDAPAALSDGDAAPADVPDVPDVRTCDPRMHIDCFAGLSCRAGVVRRSAHAPYYCCDAAECRAAWARDVCTIGQLECPMRACDDRRLRCNGAALNAAARPGRSFDLGVLCVGGGRREGDRCRADADCAPQVEGAPGRLRCAPDRGVCVPAPRPSTATGAPCVWDDDCAAGDRCDCAGTGGTGARVCVRAT
jgi:hypothetical protein